MDTSKKIDSEQWVERYGDMLYRYTLVRARDRVVGVFIGVRVVVRGQFVGPLVFQLPEMVHDLVLEDSEQPAFLGRFSGEGVLGL